MTSNDSDEFHITIVPPKPPSPVITWIGLVMNNMLHQADIDKEQEIEMAKILYDFVMANAHFFSSPILSAAKVLLEEIQKVEVSNKSEEYSSVTLY